MKAFLMGVGAGGFALIIIGVFIGVPEMQWLGTQLIATAGFVLAVRASD